MTLGRTRVIAAALLVVMVVIVFSPAPAAVKLAVAVLFVLAVPGLAILRFLPALSSAEVIALVTTFGVSLLVVASEFLVFVDQWSGRATFLVLAGIALPLLLVPDRRAGSHVVDGSQREPLHLRLLWPSGHLCCQVELNRENGQLSHVQFGHLPALSPPSKAPGDATTRLVRDGMPVFDRSLFDIDPDLVRQRTAIDITCDPILTSDDRDLFLWIGRGNVHWWARSDGAFLGLDENEDLLVVRILDEAIPSHSRLADILSQPPAD